MSTRKEKVAKKNEARQEPVMEIDFEPITPDTVDTINVQNPIPEDIPDVNDSINFRNGRIAPTVVTAEGKNVKPIVGKAVVANPKGLANVQQITPDVAIPAVTVDDDATPVEEAPKTLADYLEERRKKIEDEKTSSVKMQKYYALTDALKALADLGGSAIGGAAGGNMLDSAPDVGKYKPNKFYLDAIEKAKKADERLRALDDKDFQLALRDDDRSYQQQLKKADRDFQIKLANYNAELKKAQAAGDHERAKELLKLKGELQEQMQTKVAEIKGKYALQQKELSKEIVKMQTAGYLGGKTKKTQLWFDDGTKVDLNNDDYDALKRSIIGKRINGTLVDKTNIDRVISSNPNEIRSILNLYGIGGFSYADTEDNTSIPVQPMISFNDGSYPYYQYKANQPINYVESTEDTGFDISGYKRK